MKKLTFVALIFLIQNNVFAWGDFGHSTVGYLAEKSLSPEGKRFIYSILGAEPMAVSATWPDHVRDDERFAPFSPYHFFEIPNGLRYDTIPEESKAPRSADTIIGQGPDLLKKRSLNLPQKQVILRYLIHIVGDVHQPLHVGNGLDLGGNLCDVMFKNPFSGKEYKTNLHTVWDTGIVDYVKKKVEAERPSVKYFSYRHLGDALLEEAQVSGELEELKKLAQTSSKADWYHESSALHPEVYPETTFVQPSERTYCKILNLTTGKVENGKYDRNKVPVLSDEYVNKAMAIVKKRLLLGGLRLANEIEKLARVIGQGSWTPKKEEEFFKKILPQSAKREPSANKKMISVSHDWCHEEH